MNQETQSEKQIVQPVIRDRWFVKQEANFQRIFKYGPVGFVSNSDKEIGQVGQDVRKEKLILKL